MLYDKPFGSFMELKQTKAEKNWKISTLWDRQCRGCNFFFCVHSEKDCIYA